ncbi:hypothetical protein [Ligilactobacillus salivarius]|uniref:hypothetical protein n=1 Tax=Ligilactobacillus salivarius TaxID=1624 RepID=UPI001CDAB9EB|nr:hypothetical protein [Ligilactobacillus salivarius]
MYPYFFPAGINPNRIVLGISTRKNELSTETLPLTQKANRLTEKSEPALILLIEP